MKTMKLPNFSLVVAATYPEMGIGFQGGLPWKSLKPDMAFFKRITSNCKAAGKQNAVVMGRKTWESIPAKFRPLPNRLNVILTRNPDYEINMPDREIPVHKSFTEALEALGQREDVGDVFIIGGAQIYKEALQHESLEKIHFTKVYKNFQCDTFLQELKVDDYVLDPQGGQIFEDVPYEFCTLRPRKPAVAGGRVPRRLLSSARHEEYQYLDLIRECIESGVERGDRTGTGTLSHFGRTMRYSLRNDVFPLLTTKKVFFRGVAEELLWFIKGSTNSNELSEKKIKIWDGNGSREFLDKRGFPDREVGDLGPVYGFQWRHFGATYKDMHASYDGQGVDQLARVIDLIKNDPNNRRILLSAWNPSDLHLMALPPCHMFCQFYVANGELSCQMYQRSADTGLGVPFNIASYALLTRMIAQVCGLEAGDFVHVIGDCHVYLNHVDALKTQLEREPREFPTLKLNPDVKDIDGFKYEDFEVVNYKPYPRIKMKMAV